MTLQNLLLLTACLTCFGRSVADAADRPPNFVIIFTDDQGYADLRCFGGTHVSTPRIDQMAAEGAKLTSFYVAAPVCTPSRAALMTGCYPKRIDMATGSNFGVLLAGDTKGLHPDEITIAEVLSSAGYKTGMFGKWHLGDQPELLPTRQGFDEFFGLPYSLDIHPFHPLQKKHNFPPLPLLKGETVIEMDPDANTLTKRITEDASEPRFLGTECSMARTSGQCLLKMEKHRTMHSFTTKETPWKPCDQANGNFVLPDEPHQRYSI